MSRVNPPAEPTANEVITFVFGFEVYRKDPFGDIARPISPVVPREMGNPVRSVSAPVVELKL